MGILQISDQHLRKDPIRARNAASKPRTDNGFFGPDSITWKLGLHPAGALMGLLRASIITQLEPFGADAIGEQSVMRADPLTRVRRSINYFQATAFGDSATAIRAAQTLYRIHSTIGRVEPVTGREYNATDTDKAIWTHALGAYSILVTYRHYGGRLTGEEVDRFLEEAVIHAQFVGIAPELAPRTREQYQTIFAEWLPRMCLTHHGWDSIDFFRRGALTPAWPMVLASPGLRLISMSLIESLPREFRRIGGMEQSGLLGQASRLVVATALRVMSAPAIRPAIMLAGPEGYGTMRQALDAEPGLPLADPAIREDLHLRIRSRGAGPDWSDQEHTPHIDTEGLTSAPHAA